MIILQFGIEILGERSKHRINQQELADAIGVTRACIVDIENNRIGIDKETYDKIILAINDIATKAVA